MLRLIDERGLKDSTVYKQSNISRQHFSKIQCNRAYNPKKKTVLAFAVGLHLSEDETIDLLKSAGYAFSDGSKPVSYTHLLDLFRSSDSCTRIHRFEEMMPGCSPTERSIR